MVGISLLSAFGMYLNGAAGSGTYDSVSVADVKAALDDGTVFEMLEHQLPGDVPLSLLSPTDRKELLAEWRGFAGFLNERRKLCVDRGGLCLLVAYILFGIQQRAETATVPGSETEVF